MRNNKLFFFLLCLVFVCQTKSLTLAESFFKSNEFEFLAGKIEVSKSEIIGSGNIKVSINENQQTLQGDNFEFNKEKDFLKIVGNTIYYNLKNNLTIFSNEISYDKKNMLLKFYGNIKIIFKDDYKIENPDEIQFNQISNKIISYKKTTIKDDKKNIFELDEFHLDITQNQLNGTNVRFTDHKNNVYELKNFILDFSNKKVAGNDISVNFYNEIFNNPENEPRAKGVSLYVDSEETILKNGSFTTCKKRDECPPWVIMAKEVKHLKKKRQIQYKDALLKVYDVPVLFFPTFSHPDPTVKRQSGFLVPRLSNSDSLGSSIYIPYYKVISDSQDFTFKPKLFSDEVALQSEYRQVSKNNNTIFDGSLLKKQSASEEENSSKSHFFLNSFTDLNISKFDTSNLEINIETVSNDTYLKKYKIESPIIKEKSTLNSYVNLYANDNDLIFNLSFDVFENLEKTKTDRFEYIYPNFEIQKNIFQDLSEDGEFTIRSNFYQKKYDTNSYDAVLINDLYYSSPTITKTGFVNDLDFIIKNLNTKGKKSSKFKNSEDNKLMSKVAYKMTYPLFKENMTNETYLTPITMISYSPDKNRDLQFNDERIGIDNVFLFNRINKEDALEAGTSLTLGANFKKKYFENDRYFAMNIATNYRLKENKDLPSNGSIGEKSSDIFGKLDFNFNSNVNFNYEFSLEDDFERSNYDSISTILNYENFTSMFSYTENKKSLIGNRYFENDTKIKINENNSLKFGTRKNIDKSMTEFYDLVYQYKNDCLVAGIEYKKEYYTSEDLEPEEQIYFSLTIMPFGKATTTGISN